MICKKRRMQRVELMKQKRQRSNCSSDVSCVTFSSDSTPSASAYQLTKDELRRKKNRESAERSRLRKLALIDHLSQQARLLSAKLKGLHDENFRLQGMVASDDQTSSASGSDSDGYLSSISASSSPARPAFPTSSRSSRSSAGTNMSTFDSLGLCPSSSSNDSSDLCGSSRDDALKRAAPPAAGCGPVGAWSPQQDMEIALEELCDFDFGDGFPVMFSNSAAGFY